MAILQMGDAGGSWAPMTGGNQLGTTAPAMAPGYDDGTSGIRVTVRTGPRLSAAELAAVQADQGLICRNARTAAARNSAAAPGLAARCAALRDANFAKGIFVSEPVPPDPDYRVRLTNAGEKIIAADPQLAARRAALPASRQRGFTWAAAVSRGTRDDTYLGFLFGGPWVVGGGRTEPFDPEVKAGFDLGMSSGVTRASSPTSDEGIPRAVLIGGGVVAVAGAGFLIWKFLL